MVLLYFRPHRKSRKSVHRYQTTFKDGRSLPKYTNQAMNRDIKELCKLAGINEEIRVTTFKGMKPYIDIVDSIKASSMAKFDGLI